MVRRLDVDGDGQWDFRSRVSPIRLNEPEMATLVVKHGSPGFYSRVLEKGEVEASDEITHVAFKARTHERESDNMISLVLEPANGQSIATALPGQFVVLRPGPVSAPALMHSYSRRGDLAIRTVA